MIVEFLDGDQLGQRRLAAYMVAVVVGGDEDVDFLRPAALVASNTRSGIAVVVTGIAGIDQHRLAGRGHDQSGRAALHVDPVDIERAGLGLQKHRGRQSQENAKCSHLAGILSQRSIYSPPRHRDAETQRKIRLTEVRWSLSFWVLLRLARGGGRGNCVPPPCSLSGIRAAEQETAQCKPVVTSAPSARQPESSREFQPTRAAVIFLYSLRLGVSAVNARC